MSLSEVLEAAAIALAGDAEAIRPANGDPVRLLASLDSDAAARVLGWIPVSYTHLTLPTIPFECRSRWSPYH